mgnify:CR=1 FL=1
MNKTESSIKLLTDKSACVEAVADLISQAERHVSIFSQQLEPLLYNQPEICDTLSVLARKNKLSRIRILAQESRSMMAQGHCLISLAQRLSSYVQVRNPSTPELQRFAESWLIIDNHSMCRINNLERYEGKLILLDRLEVKNQLEFFDMAWEHSLPDPNIRQLNI